ncbi:unnamed protein product [Cylindrotheca closterium]|uniref:Uncharacterized protein n=1 Tax=Cylindrotheca closterium TaxID=2856 RepID=A0AAD2PY30_9STRA|nr:unnamed protein product [Cylindrotheca closterium]
MMALWATKLSIGLDDDKPVACLMSARTEIQLNAECNNLQAQASILQAQANVLIQCGLKDEAKEIAAELKALRENHNNNIQSKMSAKKGGREQMDFVDLAGHDEDNSSSDSSIQNENN